jgi:Na+-transporting NADH:ubiquinone oxidoreductase subunit B
MKPLRTFLDRLEPLFTKGGRFEQFYALFEAVDTFFFSPPDLTRGSPHVRDAIDLKRVMILVVIASSPAAVMGMWNTGFQANTAMQSLGLVGIDGWRGIRPGERLRLLPSGAPVLPADLHHHHGRRPVLGSPVCRRTQP